ncbi:MAG: flagellar basal body-associated FliL family protein [Planctomycetota bacterium]|jgi:flagellar basal body-associated protein FliL|nr:flagellar basal body-associated FliL family protein [Planctomycetota bacterium]
MADDDDNKDKAADGGGGKGAMGPIIALVMVLLIGVGLGLVIKWAVSGEEVKEETTTREITSSGPLWEQAQALDVGDIVANIQGESGRRYVKVNVQIWVKTEDAQSVSRPDLLPVLRETLQDKVRSYKMQELETGNVLDSLRRNFRDELNKRLREVMGEVDDPERTYVNKVVLDGFLIQ